MKLPLALLFLALCAPALVLDPRQSEALSIEPKTWHLGDEPTPTWTEASVEPEGARLDVTFSARAIEGEGTLRLKQRSVDNDWFVEINGMRIAALERRSELGEHYYPIPSGVLVDGDNTFAIVPAVPTDDITVGEIVFWETSLRDVFDLRRVTVSVRDTNADLALPARVTITNPAGELVPIYYAEALSTAVREGVVYTSDGTAILELPAGEYVVQALRGSEWSMASTSLAVTDSHHTVALALSREVDTRGFVATDTHIHTLTHSGHGDASVEERLVTLAGEGVELAIATDHNHNTNYGPTQEAMGLSAYFTSVVGNEVTTPIGHFNAFPLSPDDEVPLHTGKDIVEIIASIRANGAEAIILNHPRWPDHARGPHGVIELNEFTGDWAGDWACTFDAIELINSDTEESQPMVLFRDWFALMNRGERVFAVGSSDSHTVGSPVGQGRTYAASSTDVPSEIDVNECANNIADGHSSISMGIFADMRHAEHSVMGETLGVDALAGMELRVASPSWIQPEHVTFFANGVAVSELSLQDKGEGVPMNEHFPLDASMNWPTNDFWLVAIVTGAGARVPGWPQLNDYTLAATNPVFIDVDGDGAYSSPRAIAVALVREQGTQPSAVQSILAYVDSATAVQVMRLVHMEYVNRAQEAAVRAGAAFVAENPMLRGWVETLGEMR